MTDIATEVDPIWRDRIADKEPMLSVYDLEKIYPRRRGTSAGTGDAVRAVAGISFDVLPGESFGLVGESGCGKSTTARMICRLLEPTNGRIVFEGKDVVRIRNRSARLAFRRSVQIVFQDPYASLNPRKTVGATIGEPLRIHKIASDGAGCLQRIQELMERVGLNPEHYNRLPHEFSGGQRQRVGIARALAVDPRLLVCDEPVSALDVSIQAQVLNLLQDLQRDLGLTLIFVAHDLSVVRYLCSRLAVMQEGEIVEGGTTDQIFADPSHSYTKKLLAAIPVPSADAREQRLAEIDTDIALRQVKA